MQTLLLWEGETAWSLGWGCCCSREHSAPQHRADCASPSQIPDLGHTRTAGAGFMWSSAWSWTSMET